MFIRKSFSNWLEADLWVKGMTEKGYVVAIRIVDEKNREEVVMTKVEDMQKMRFNPVFA